jgi:integrase
VKLHITERAIKDIVVPQGKKYILAFDTEQTGFAVLKTDKGAMSYLIVFRDAANKQRQEKLASVFDISATAARDLAKLRLATIGEQKNETQRGQRRKSMPTMDDFFFNTFLPIVKANSRSYETHASLYRNHVQDQFGHRRLDEVGEQEIVEFKSHLESKLVAGGRWEKQATKTLSEGTVKRILILVRHIFNEAIRDKSNTLRDNPTHALKLTTVRDVKGVFLTKTQLARLMKAAEAVGESMPEILLVIAATGLRRENVFAMEWAWLDEENGTLSIPASADKAKKGFTLHLSAGVLAVLRKQRSIVTGPWVFPNPKTGKPYVSRWASWDTIRKNAGLDKVRIHDLRHTYASMMLESGSDIVDVQQALGHTQLKTTAIYLHLRDERKRANANAASMAMGLFA